MPIYTCRRCVRRYSSPAAMTDFSSALIVLAIVTHNDRMQSFMRLLCSLQAHSTEKTRLREQATNSIVSRISVRWTSGSHALYASSLRFFINVSNSRLLITCVLFWDAMATVVAGDRSGGEPGWAALAAESA